MAGWKLVHGDVFRKPQYSTLLCVVTGSGMQLLGMSVALASTFGDRGKAQTGDPIKKKTAEVTIVFALLGFLSPAHRGSSCLREPVSVWKYRRTGIRAEIEIKH